MFQYTLIHENNGGVKWSLTQSNHVSLQIDAAEQFPFPTKAGGHFLNFFSGYQEESQQERTTNDLRNRVRFQAYKRDSDSHTVGGVRRQDFENRSLYLIYTQSP